jgi:hypothetical protein
MELEEIAKKYEFKAIDCNRLALNYRVRFNALKEKEYKSKAAHYWQIWKYLKELIAKEPIAIIDDNGNAYHVVDVEALSEVVRKYEG